MAIAGIKKEENEVNELASQLKSTLQKSKFEEAMQEEITLRESDVKEELRTKLDILNVLIKSKDRLLTRCICIEKYLSKLSNEYKLDNLEKLEEKVLNNSINEWRHLLTKLTGQMSETKQVILNNAE